VAELYGPINVDCGLAFEPLKEVIDRFIQLYDWKHKGVVMIVLDEAGQIIFEGVTPGLAAVSPEHWAHDFREIALGKARASLESGESTSTMIDLDRDSVPEFCRYAGGVPGELPGVVARCSVGVSGARAIFDEIFAWWMVDVLHGFAKVRKEALTT
jgi:hypothetical protein